MRTNIFIILFFVSSNVFGQLGAATGSLVGGFGEFHVEDGILSMTQVNKESNFLEETVASCFTYKGLLGYTISAQYAPWLFADLSGGISYARSEIRSNNYLGQIFEYYSVGDYGKTNDFGLHVHLDLGSWLFVGVSGEAGLSNTKFTDSDRPSQLVKDFGTYYAAYLRVGVALPIYVGILKAFAQVGSSNHFFNSVKWIDEDKKYRNFSKINYVQNSAISNILSVGFNLTVTIPDW